MLLCIDHIMSTDGKYANILCKLCAGKTKNVLRTFKVSKQCIKTHQGPVSYSSISFLKHPQSAPYGPPSSNQNSHLGASFLGLTHERGRFVYWFFKPGEKEQQLAGWVLQNPRPNKVPRWKPFSKDSSVGWPKVSPTVVCSWSSSKRQRNSTIRSKRSSE